MARQSFESAAFDGDDDKPVDPAFLRVQTRLRRLMLIAGLTLGLGIIAVFAAMLYRIATYDATPAAPLAAASIPNLSRNALGLPADATLISTALDGNRVALTYATEGGDEMVVVDIRTGVVVSRLKVGD